MKDKNVFLSRPNSGKHAYMNGQSQLFRFSVNHCAKWAENAVNPPHPPKAADEYRGGIFFFSCVGVDRIAIRKGGGGDGGKDTFRNTGRGKKKRHFPAVDTSFSHNCRIHIMRHLSI